MKAQAEIVLPPSGRAEKVMVSPHQGRGRFISPVSERVRWPGKCSSGTRARQVSRSNDSMVLCWTCRLCDTIKLGPHQTWLRAVCHSCHSVCSSVKEPAFTLVEQETAFSSILKGEKGVELVPRRIGPTVLDRTLDEQIQRPSFRRPTLLS